MNISVPLQMGRFEDIRFGPGDHKDPRHVNSYPILCHEGLRKVQEERHPLDQGGATYFAEQVGRVTRPGFWGDREAQSYTLLAPKSAPNVLARELVGFIPGGIWSRRSFTVMSHDTTLEAAQKILHSQLGLSGRQPPIAQGCVAGSGASISFRSAATPPDQLLEKVCAVILDKDKVGGKVFVNPALQLEFDKPLSVSDLEKILSITRHRNRSVYAK